MRKTDLKNIIAPHLLVRKVFKFYNEWNNDNIGKVFAQYEEYLESTCPKVNYINEYYGDDVYDKKDRYSVTASRGYILISFEIPFEGTEYKPSIYNSVEELLSDKNITDDDEKEEIMALKPRQTYSNDESRTIERDKYGMWVVQDHDTETTFQSFKVSISLDLDDALTNGLAGFVVKYDYLEKYGYKDEKVVRTLADAHKLLMDCMDDLAERAMETYYDYDQDEYQREYDTKTYGKEEKFDPDDPRQGHLNFESLRRLFGGLLC